MNRTRVFSIRHAELGNPASDVLRCPAELFGKQCWHHTFHRSDLHEISLSAGIIVQWTDRDLETLALLDLAEGPVILMSDPATPEAIRAEIAYLEGELARLSGEPIRVWDARSGDWRGEKDIPEGGAFVDYRFSDDDSYREWYATIGGAKAALVLVARKTGGSLDAGGLNLTDGMDRGVMRAWITRRDQAPLPTLWVVNPMLDIRNTVDVYRDRERALDRCDDIERRHPGVRVSPVRVKPGDPSYERHAAVAE